jgi:hypothetical protein
MNTASKDVKDQKPPKKEHPPILGRYLSKEELKDSPSRRDNIHPSEENTRIANGVVMIQDIVISIEENLTKQNKLKGKLKEVYITGALYFQCFFWAHSLKKFDFEHVALACTLLASKVEERKLGIGHIIASYKNIKKVAHHDQMKRHAQEQRAAPPQFVLLENEDLRKRVFFLENLLADVIGYSFAVKTAHNRLSEILKAILKHAMVEWNTDLQNSVFIACWNYANDHMKRWPMPLSYPPQTIAVAIVHLVFQQHKITIRINPERPAEKWYVVLYQISKDDIAVIQQGLAHFGEKKINSNLLTHNNPHSLHISNNSNPTLGATNSSSNSNSSRSKSISSSSRAPAMREGPKSGSGSDTSGVPLHPSTSSAHPQNPHHPQTSSSSSSSSAGNNSSHSNSFNSNNPNHLPNSSKKLPFLFSRAPRSHVSNPTPETSERAAAEIPATTPAALANNPHSLIKLAPDPTLPHSLAGYRARAAGTDEANGLGASVDTLSKEAGASVEVAANVSAVNRAMVLIVTINYSLFVTPVRLCLWGGGHILWIMYAGTVADRTHSRDCERTGQKDIIPRPCTFNLNSP